ncbi:MAG TPA: cytochrome b [Rickettsiales bacterium]|nr:cytochrome b [Rickettsiales bacterium]
MEQKYHLSIRITHWLMALLVISLLIIGLIVADLPKGHEWHDPLMSLHKSFGVTAFILCIIRIGLRLKFGAPALPEVIAPLERQLAKLGHFALYGFMLAMPITGYLMSTWFGFPVKLFGLELPKLVGVDRGLSKLMQETHENLGLILIGVIALHVLAVAKHRIKDRVNLLQRMT